MPSKFPPFGRSLNIPECVTKWNLIKILMVFVTLLGIYNK